MVKTVAEGTAYCFNLTPACRPPLAGSRRLAASLAIVVLSMLLLFTVPAPYFAPATFFSTACMIAAAYVAGALVARRPVWRSVVLGLGSAGLLYGIFYVGAWAVSTFHPFGVTAAAETSIYSLIASPSNPVYLQGAVLIFDSAGYEGFFRGVLQQRLSPRLGVMAAPAVALRDAALHVATLNPLWVGATFVTDLVWGVTYHYCGGKQSSFTSHLVWDIAIFVLRPIK